MFSITSDYRISTGCPEPQLRRIADAGFTHVHWCHHWNTDFLYERGEVAQIGRWLRDCGLAVLNLHGSAGEEKCWFSPREYERRAGAALVRNRVAMAARLGARVVIMHVPLWQPAEAENGRQWEALHRSLDALEPVARTYGVRLAIENMADDDFAGITRLLAAYGPDYLGVCYDAGHGNIGRDGLAHLEVVKDRLIAVHLHDNDGKGDQHKLPLEGTIDWPRLAALLATTACADEINLESIIASYDEEEDVHLRRAYVRAGEVARLVAAAP